MAGRRQRALPGEIDDQAAATARGPEAGRGIGGGFVNDASARPMLRGLYQFFRLAPLMLSMYAFSTAMAKNGTSSNSSNPF